MLGKLSINSGEIILIINAGSSSIKFAIIDANVKTSANNLICDGQLSGIGHKVHFRVLDRNNVILNDTLFSDGMNHEAAMNSLLDWINLHFEREQIIAVGHRVVHGGDRYITSTIINDAVLKELRCLIPLAPLHQPHSIAAMMILKKRYPTIVQVACFDTSFHHTNPRVATNFALPRALTEEGIRRYGFHGISYEYITSVMESVMGKMLATGRVVVAHLGAGASMCAINNGQSIASTMGFTALDGLPMGSRCGNLDPGVVLYLMQEKKMSAEQITHFLYNECGMLGVSGVSDDMKILLESTNPNAAEAIDLFVYKISRELGSLTAALGGLDALIFTAGIGEHAPQIRSKVVKSSAWLGVDINEEMNNAATVDNAMCISTKKARTSVWVIPTNENLMISRHVQDIL